MATFNQMPNEILEQIFDHLDYRSRRNLTLVCRRWNAVLLSDRFITRHVTLVIDGQRTLTLHKHPIHRTYPNLTLKLDNAINGDAFKGLRLLPTIVPSPSTVALHLAFPNDPRWVALCEEQQFVNLRTVQRLHLTGSCRTEHPRKPLTLQMDQLRALDLVCSGVQDLWLVAPKLSRLHLHVLSEEHLDFLLHFIHQLRTLSIVFDAKESFFFYHLKPTRLRELAIDRRQKGMTKSERNISIAFFKRLDQLQRLELRVKFIDSYVLHTIAEGLKQLCELSLEVAEGTIELKHIASLTRLQRLRIVACRVNLQNVHLPALESLELGSAELPGTYLEGIEGLMAFHRMRSLTLMNVKVYPEMLQLTPTYSVERMVIAYYRRLEETHLLILVKRFPALRWLRVSHCHGVYQRELDKLKRMMPTLAVAFDEAKSDRI
uniref:F-box domain-containing protein n=1 Tax=Anopheles stephensi TaxID=30069 RepID=A0A182YC49_ANOST